MDPGAPGAATPPSVARYGLGVGITVAAILSQYSVPALVPASRAIYGSFVGDLAVVYGLPIVAFALLVGAGPLRNWAAGMGRAIGTGLGWFSAMTLLGVGVLLVLVALYEAFDPSALQLLSRENPVLREAASDPWFFVGFSFAIGAFEETIFRGWIFGFWRGRSASWLTPAILTSLLFAAVHLYYGTTYGPASPLIFPTLFLLGFAFAATYRASGGNLVVPAALHGAYDAASFLTLISPVAAVVLQWSVVLVGGLVGLVYYVARTPDDGSSWPPPG